MEKPVEDIVVLRLFDSLGECRYIEPIRAVRKILVREGTTTWTLKKKKTHTVVFTAHKDTTIAFGTFTPKTTEKVRLWPIKAYIPTVRDVVLKKGCTLTLLLGGVYGDEPLMMMIT